MEAAAHRETGPAARRLERAEGLGAAGGQFQEPAAIEDPEEAVAWPAEAEVEAEAEGRRAEAAAAEAEARPGVTAFPAAPARAAAAADLAAGAPPARVVHPAEQAALAARATRPAHKAVCVAAIAA